MFYGQTTKKAVQRKEGSRAVKKSSNAKAAERYEI
jgi:hypothetical protein